MNIIYFFGRDKHYRSTLVKKANLKPDDVVLDLCCGTGLNFPFLLKRIKTQGLLLGVDISSKMLRQIKERKFDGNINLIRSDAAHLPIRNKSLNVIFATFCLKITPSLETVIEEATRVLKPNGGLGILANSKPTGILEILGNGLTRLISLISKVNFEIDLNYYLSGRFGILEDTKMHGGLIHLLIGKLKDKDM